MYFLYWGMYHNVHRQKRYRAQRGYPSPHGKDSCPPTNSIHIELRNNMSLVVSAIVTAIVITIVDDYILFQ
jgi:hypothetical protein